jgi:hypothetical protein
VIRTNGSRSRAPRSTGDRSIAARFHGGACEVVDGSIAPLVEEDRATFYAAFDAIVDAVLSARGGGARAPTRVSPP